jgi:cold shock CspA family protein
MTREHGTVVRFFADRSPPFGFIEPDPIGDDIFLSARALDEAGIVGPIEVGARISYESRPSKKSGRPQAWNVEVESTT